MARADGDRNSFSPLMLIGGGILVASITFGGAYLWLGQSSSDQLVVIKAPTTPVRVAPEDRGGLKLNSIDSPVMDLLVEQANQDDKDAEVLVPPESEPELPPIEVAETENTEEEAAVEASPEVVEDSQPEVTDNQAENVQTEAGDDTPQQAQAETVVSVDTSDNGDSAEAEETPETQTKETQTTETQTSENQTVENDQPESNSSDDEIADAISSLSSDQSQLQPEPKPETPKIVPPSNQDAPRFVVQFAAFKSETRAKNTAAVLATKHASRLNEITLGYMRRDEYWRVVTEPMPRADATSLCRMFRSVGQDCITKLMEQPQ